MLFGKPKTIKVREPADFDSVTDYLVGLSVEDITKLNKVVEIRRGSRRDCTAVLGEPLEPYTFINPADDEPEFLDLLQDDGQKHKVVIDKKEKPKK